MVTIVLFVFACNPEYKDMNEKTVDTVKTIIKKPEVSKIDKPKVQSVIQKRTCVAVVKDIVSTSPRFKQVTKGLNDAIVKNGGISFGVSLEKSPHPKSDKAWSYSKTYDFVIYEKYSDRQLNTVRFSFDPRTKQLREYDPILDEFKPIDFNKKLLMQYDSVFNLTHSIEKHHKADFNK
jgi:hypothetical protein